MSHAERDATWNNFEFTYILAVIHAPGRGFQASSQTPNTSGSPVTTDTGLPHLMELNRHPSLYFEDGDIVLSAYATLTSRQLFRVHRVFLSHYSEVFRGMFAVVSTTNIDEAYDGTPLLRMPDDDTAEAVASLLDVMYNSRCALYFSAHAPV